METWIFSYRAKALLCPIGNAYNEDSKESSCQKQRVLVVLWKDPWLTINDFMVLKGYEKARSRLDSEYSGLKVQGLPLDHCVTKILGVLGNDVNNCTIYINSQS